MVRRNKYGAVKTKYRGHTYDSKAEAAHAMRLDLLVKAGKLDRWEQQVPFPMEVNGQKICVYKADFVCYHNRRKWVEEVKGRELPVWRLKAKLFRALYPDVELVVISSAPRRTVRA